ncbi:zinc finger protein 598-like [Sinocyclocheilus anshuiensis]|uniref:RING-type E3 ubiquitin transferase n=1 Tax=Sinocyclocheilus anshuiensis TaxID=1608454 RepID=A0A671T081_9TELE|nr:PREDICTED: zinc finger protein 598-like [Sinocyclocheilus anshuiensis]
MRIIARRTLEHTQPAPSNSMESTAKRDAESTCVLCCQDIDLFAVGKCDHPVCYRCSTKMRLLCEQKYCAVCREQLDKVVFIKKLEPFAALNIHQYQYEKKFDIYFADGKIYAQFRKILLHECPQCPEPKVFSKFEELEQHMRKQHELFCCKLCAKHLKIFSCERKWYSRKDLARHRTQGDPDDTSHRGHPLCKFCDDRYLDNDELLKHLRRDHYFCHFCDADGAQEYYSDYQYLSEHFRESHYLCQEGRCSTEQFTHAFRTEIDYKAHKAAAHSKNRAEARQNRQIDIQFNYALRQQRRNGGLIVGGDDYEEVDRFNRQGRPGRGQAPGRQQNVRSWRYNREEEDREIAAALRASMASHQEERSHVQERSSQKPRKDEKMEPDEMRNNRGTAKQTNEMQAQSVKSNPSLAGQDFPVLGAAAPPAPIQSKIKQTSVSLKEDDFPSLSGSVGSAPMTPAYKNQPKKHSSFQEEDFPALISKIKPLKSQSNTTSAWSQAGSKPAVVSNKPVVLPTKTAPTVSSSILSASDPPPSGSVPQPLTASSSRRKKKLTSSETHKAPPKVKCLSSSDDEDLQTSKTAQEIRTVPTMLDISTLLTVKDGSSQTNPKTNKKKKQATTSSLGSPSCTPESVSKMAHKENVPETKPPDNSLPSKTNSFIKGLPEKPAEALSPTSFPENIPSPLKQPVTDQPPPPKEEEFPALISRKPPPGFKSAFPLKSIQSVLPPPPPGLGPVVSKPPPGFTGIPLNSNVESSMPAVDRVTPAIGPYLIPDNFQQRNMDLIQSIKNYLQNDETKFNEFKNYSGQFRQGIIPAVQYYKSCQELLGENFNRVFNELLVLLPDTRKQQELLIAHGDFKALEKQQEGSKPKKNKKKAWQTGTTSNSVELDCQVCPTCKQVLALKDFNTHKTLHIGDDDFPSLQAISKIIS